MRFFISTLILCMACLLLSFKPDKKSTRVVFFGDSITAAGVQTGGYITQLRDSLAERKARRYELIGAGIGGNKIYDLFLRHEEDVLKKKPDVVVIYVGVNDVWHKLTHRTGTDADKFERFYSELIRRMQKKGIRVVLCTPACIGEKRNGANALDAELDNYSQIIRNLAEHDNLRLCDLRRAFVEYTEAHNTDNQEQGILTTDGVHLNERGNRLVASLLLECL